MSGIDPSRLGFLDEPSPPTTLTLLRARAPRGQRAIGRVPRGRREAISWLATLPTRGIGESLLVRGAVDRLVFEAFVERVLVPSLRPGQIVIWDNLSVHKSARATALIQAAGCQVVFLPTYAPDLNPIEPAFAKPKQAWRRAGARSWERVVAAVGETLRTVTAADARAFFTDAGFVRS
jgi:transposase